MNFYKKLIDRSCNVCTLGAAFSVGFMVFLILLEIILRNVFDYSLLVVEEMVGYLLSSAIFLAIGPTFNKGDMIRMTIVTDRLKKRSMAVLEVVSLGLAFCLTIFWIRYVFRAAWKFYNRGMASNGAWPIPLWIPEAVSLFGLLILALVLSYQIVSRFSLAIEGS
jgi:TRAP-type C4-dicarboxylate transport system permease small subunit